MKKATLFLSILFFSFTSIYAQEKLIQPANFKTTAKALEVIKQLEDYRSYVYYDGNMNQIFGYGHLVWENEEKDALISKFGYETILETGERKVIPGKEKLTDSQKSKYIEELFQKDVATVENFMKENITVPLKQNQVDALVIYLFWRGGNPMNPDVNELYELINKKKTNAVTDFMINRPKSDKNYLQGIVDRNTKTAQLYSTGVYSF
jgi:GH24 family phage-related lysozyme (muramidase)